MNAHYDEGMIDIFAPNIEGFSFQPTMHVHYQERLVDFPDELPKFADLPKDFGGTDELMEDR